MPSIKGNIMSLPTSQAEKGDFSTAFREISERLNQGFH
jgi:hypothetical protein